MNLRDGRLSGYDKPSGCNHFPVGQARCDGRSTRVGDRPSHATSFPISDPIIHENGDRMYWNGLYGMNDMKLDGVVKFGRSWAYAPEIKVEGDFVSKGYDRSERCYQIAEKSIGLENGLKKSIRITVKGTADSPIINPAFYVKDWNGELPRVLVDGKESDGTRLGLKHELDGTDLIIYLALSSDNEINIEITQ